MPDLVTGKTGWLLVCDIFNGNDCLAECPFLTGKPEDEDRICHLTSKVGGRPEECPVYDAFSA